MSAVISTNPVTASSYDRLPAHTKPDSSNTSSTSDTTKNRAICTFHLHMPTSPLHTPEPTMATADLIARIQRLEDLHAIQQLRAHYCQALDDGRWSDLADTFTPDGAFIGLSTARGREEMLQFFPTLNASTVTSWWHFSSNETVELDGDSASGVTWLLQPCVVGGEAQLAAGRYEDEMVRTPDGWRFQTRKVSFFFWAGLEKGWDAGRFEFPPAVGAADARTVERLEGRGKDAA